MSTRTLGRHPEASSTNVGNTERWISTIAGGAVALYGLTRGSLPGVALGALVGAPLIYRGVGGRCPIFGALGIDTAARDGIGSDGRHVVEEAVTINRPAAELYRFWRAFENLPRFMRHLDSVRPAGDRRSHWIARAPAGATVEWDAEIVEERPDELIRWRSLPGAAVENAGAVRFRPAPGDRGTEVAVTLEYRPPAGIAGAALAKLFGEEPSQQVDEDLHRFKQLMEAGEVATNDGQPAGPAPSRILSLAALKERVG